MKKAINDLWNGNIFPQEYKADITPEMEELLKKATEHEDAFTNDITKEQKQSFHKYTEFIDQYQTLYKEQLFEYAFKLGARLMLEILTD